MNPVQAEPKAGKSDPQYNANGGTPFPKTRRRNRNRMISNGKAPEDAPTGDPQDIQDGETEESKEKDQMDLAEFINVYKEGIARTVTESYAPIYQPNQPRHQQPLPKLVRPPIGAQEHALRGAVLSLQVNRGTVIVGEMGTGKTYIGAAAAHMAGFQNILVLAPPHLVRKWKREIEMTVPGAMASIVRNITDLKRLQEPGLIMGTRFTIMSREAAKLSYWWEPAYVTRQTVLRNAEIAIHCPECSQRILWGTAQPPPWRRPRSGNSSAPGAGLKCSITSDD